MYITIFFFIIPLVLIAVFIISTTFPNISNKFGGISNIISFTSALLTYIYVVLTGVMVRQIKKTSEEESRPYIIVDIEFTNRMAYFVLKNIGKLPAKELILKVNPDIQLITKKTLTQTIFSKPISLIPPGKEIRTILDVSHSFLRDENPKIYQFEIKYNWGNKQKEKEDYIIDVSMNKGIVYVEEKGISDIAKSLDKINNKFSDIVHWNGIYCKTTKDLQQENKKAEEFYKKAEDNKK